MITLLCQTDYYYSWLPSTARLLLLRTVVVLLLQVWSGRQCSWWQQDTQAVTTRWLWPSSPSPPLWAECRRLASTSTTLTSLLRKFVTKITLYFKHDSMLLLVMQENKMGSLKFVGKRAYRHPSSREYTQTSGSELTCNLLQVLIDYSSVSCGRAVLNTAVRLAG